MQEERKACNQRHFTRELIHFRDEDGNLVIKATLPPEQGALVLNALEAATESLKEDDQFDPRQAQPDDIEYRYHVNRLQSFGIDEETLWSYCGDKMDYDQAVDGLVSQRDKARKEMIRVGAYQGTT